MSDIYKNPFPSVTQTGNAGSKTTEAKLNLPKPVAVKETVGDKFKKAFIQEDIQTAAKSVFFEMIIPKVKNLISDMIIGTIEHIFYGGTSSVTNKTNNLKYNNISYQQNKPTVITYASSRIDDITSLLDDKLYYRTKEDAENVINEMRLCLEQGQNVTVAQVLDSIGIVPEYTYNYYGWTNLKDARTVYSRGGWKVILPTPVSIK